MYFNFKLETVSLNGFKEFHFSLIFVDLFVYFAVKIDHYRFAAPRMS
jgi:hypothetical protein